MKTDEKDDQKIEDATEKLPEPEMPNCANCKKQPFGCKCGTWEDLEK